MTDEYLKDLPLEEQKKLEKAIDESNNRMYERKRGIKYKKHIPFRIGIKPNRKIIAKCLNHGVYF